MLAGDAQALLGGRHARHGALFFAKKELLELHHARIGEQQRGIIGGNQRTGRQDVVPVTGKELEIFLTDFLGGEHERLLRGGGAAGPPRLFGAWPTNGLHAESGY